MKKFIALSAVLAVLAGAGFAEVSVSGQVDTVVMPLQVVAPDEGDTLIGAAVGRDADDAGTRVRIGIVAQTEDQKAGLNFKLQFFTIRPTGQINFDDFAEVWWKPVDQLKIEAGKFVNDTLRGKIGDDNWQKYTLNMKDPDHIFSRFRSQGWGADPTPVGFMLGITPIAPLYIGVAVPALDQFVAKSGNPFLTGSYSYYEWDNDTNAIKGEEKTEGNVAHVYEKIQAGVGYTIENIGLVRAQYVGASNINPEDQWKNPLNVRRIEAAFAFTGMSGLVIDVGGKIPLAFSTYEETKTITTTTTTTAPSTTATGTFTDASGNPQSVTITIPGEKKTTTTSRSEMVRVEDGTTYQAPFQVSLGVGYTLDSLDIKARVDAQFMGRKTEKNDEEYNIGPYINAHLWPSYKLDDFSEGLSAGLDLGFEFTGEDTDEEGDVIGKTDTFDGRNGGIHFGIGAWIKKAYGGASIKGGLGYQVGSEVHSVKYPGVFSIPIIFEYSF
jgi:hypothetical protein